MLLSDHQLIGMHQSHQMLEPFVPHLVRQEASGAKVISYGLSSYGYDIRLGTRFYIPKASRRSRIFQALRALLGGGLPPLDPKQANHTDVIFDEVITDQPLTIPPHGFLLAESLEYFDMPRDVSGVCLGKSTYARCALLCNTTPLEPGWKGILTIELSNTSDYPIIIYPMEGITQIWFLQGDYTPITSYADRAGKYQGQQGVTTAKL